MGINLKKETRVAITDGPNQHSLMTSLGRPARLPNGVAVSAEATAVQFSHKVGHTTRTFFVAIDSMEREDGSGERWNVTGRVVFQCDFPGKKFKGYYDHVKRGGTFTFSEV